MDVGHPMTSMAAMRSFRRDPSVTARELPKGTVRRILGIARPYRRDLTFFLALPAYLLLPWVRRMLDRSEARPPPPETAEVTGSR